MTSSAPSSRPFRAPELRTQRLILRDQRVEDVPALVDLWSRPEVYRHIGGKPRTQEDVWNRLLFDAGAWSLFGYGSWAVTDAATQDYLGTVGFLEAAREMQPPFVGVVEMGWVISPAAHGRGIAQEAIEAILAWFSTAHPGRKTACIISVGNEPSLKLAERVGFRHGPTIDYKGTPTIQLFRP